MGQLYSKRQYNNNKGVEFWEKNALFAPFFQLECWKYSNSSNLLVDQYFMACFHLFVFDNEEQLNQ